MISSALSIFWRNNRHSVVGIEVLPVNNLEHRAKTCISAALYRIEREIEAQVTNDSKKARTEQMP